MSVNSSSPTNTTSALLYHCFAITVSIFISAAFTVFLLLPLSIFVLHFGRQRWRRQRSLTPTSSSDVFSFNMASMELISVSGWSLLFCGSYADLPDVALGGFYVFFIVFPGYTAFHLLTCVERYLAVLHPITYRGLRQSWGVRVRNISIGCIWLMCCGWGGLTALYEPEFPIVPFFSLVIFSLFVVSFCSISVLHVLIRPRPGEVGGDKERVDQSKRRAFYTIVTIVGVLGLMCVGTLVCLSLDFSPLLSYSDGCMVLMFAIWFSLPSSLVSPLLLLHRAGKLPLCSSKAKQLKS